MSNRFLTTILVFVVCSSAWATKRYCTSGGSGDNNGASWADGTSDVQKIINASSSGDTVWVAAGTYYPNRKATDLATIAANDRSNAFVLKSGVKIFGGFAGTETYFSQRNIITNITTLSGDLGTQGNNSDNAYIVVIAAGSLGTAELNGFTITGGNATFYNGITVNSTSLDQSKGGGIACYSSSPILSNLIVSNNTAYSGGGVCIYGASPTMCNITISGNTSITGAGMLITSSASPQIENITIYNNTSTDDWRTGGGILSESSSTPTIKNALIYKNTSHGSGAGVYLNGGTMTLVNATVVNNTVTGTSTNGDGSGIKVQSGTFNLHNSIVWGNTVDNVTKNVNGTINYSYCLVESGTVSDTGIISNSIPWFVGASSDNYRIPSWSPCVNAGSNSLNASTTDLDGNSRLFGSTIDLGAYECQSAPTVLTKTRTIYVKKSATGTNDGSSWTNAFTELSDALYESDNSGTVAQIWVAAGTYIPTRYAGNGSNAGDKSFVLQKDVAIYGGFAGTESSLSQRNWASNATILSGNNTMFHVIISSGVVGTAVLDGFSITGGKALNAVTPSVNDNIITSARGGGIYCVASSPTFSNLKIYSNQSDYYGGGVYCQSNASPKLINTLIYNNSTGQYAGGVYSDSSNPLLINCTVANNTGAYSGAGVNGTCVVKNSIIWNNTVSGSANNISGSITFNYSLVQNGTVSDTSIVSNSDPLFVNSGAGNYRLQVASSAKNIGNNSYLTALSVTTDLDGLDRFSSTVDLGAYEYRGIIYVKKGSTGTNGLSWGDALGELSDAITKANATNASVAGTITDIWVAAGTYYPTAVPEWGGTRDQAFIMPANIKVYGGFVGTESNVTQRDYLTNETILSGDLGADNSTGNNAYHVVAYSGNVGTAELNGFTIKDGYADDGATKTFNGNSINRNTGAGIVCHTSSPSLQNLKISNCYTNDNGAGVFCYQSSPTINNCQIFSNQAAREGGGIFITDSSAPYISNCKIYNNAISNSNGGGFKCKNNCNAQIFNCLFYGNTATGSGGAIDNDGGVLNLINSTIVNNSVSVSYGNGGGVFVESGNTLNIKNCIIWGNTVNGSVNNADGSNGSTLNFTTSLVESKTATGIISNSNPLFCNVGTNDYTLTKFSPAINKGTNSANALTTDLAGNTRIYNSGTIDLGAYEYQANVPTYAAAANGVLYVKKGATGGGSSWSDAIGELSDALLVSEMISGVSQIWTAAGTYYPDNTAGTGSTSRDKSFNLLSNIKLYGGFAGTETATTQRRISSHPSILSGDLGTVGDNSDNAYHVVTVSGSLGTASLDGFTITGGNANGSSNITINSNLLERNIGGGIFTCNSSVPFKNLTLSGNTATKGGGMYAFHNNAIYDSLTVSSNTASDKGAGIYFNSGTFTLQNSSLLSNTAQVDGGGADMYDWPNMTLKNLVIKSNIATTGRGGGLCVESVNTHEYYNLMIAQNQAGTYGGGICAEDSPTPPTYNNITLAHNQAATDGAGIYVKTGKNAVFNNSVVWGNRKTNGTINNNVGTISYNYSLVQGASLSSNTIVKNINPLFLDSVGGDFRLKYNSPAINQGNNSYISAVSTDLAGNNRIKYSTVDLGAYEYNQTNKWVGSVSTDPANGQNWSQGSVLANNDVLEFDASAQRDLLLTADKSITYLYNHSSRVLNANGHKLTLTGNVNQSSAITASAAGSSVEFAGTSNQSISSGMFSNDSICNLIVNNASNVTLSGNLHLANNITATIGKLDAYTNSPSVYYSGQLLDGVFTNNRAYNLTLYNTSGYAPASDLVVGNNLVIGRNVTLTLNPGVLVNVAGSITNNNGVDGLLIKSSPTGANGSLIFHNASNNPLYGTVEMYSKAFKDPNGPTGFKYKWQFFGIPLRSVQASPTFDGSYISEYNATSATSSWTSLANSALLTSFKGYEITQLAAKTISFQGILENADMNVNLAYNSGALYLGQHIISNPYTAAINITNISFTNCDGSVYQYNTGSKSDWPGYQANTNASNPGQYIASTPQTAGVGGIPATIPSMQGFLVKANAGGGNISYPYNSLTSKNSDPQRVKSNETATRVCAVVSVASAQYADKMWLFSDATCTNGFDAGWDAKKIRGTSVAPQLYAVEKDGEYQIDCKSTIVNTPICFKAGVDSVYSLKINGINLSQTYSTLYLVDSVANKVVSLQMDSTVYQFSATPNTSSTRFRIVESAGITTDSNPIEAEYMKGSFYVNGGKLYVAEKCAANYMNIYTATGKLIRCLNKNQWMAKAIDLQLQGGIYLLKSSDGEAKVVVVE